MHLQFSAFMCTRTLQAFFFFKRSAKNIKIMLREKATCHLFKEGYEMYRIKTHVERQGGHLNVMTEPVFFLCPS